MSYKNIVVTGISSGIGRATAIQLVKDGYFVSGNVRNDEDRLSFMDVLNKEELSRLSIFTCDLANPVAIQEWIQHGLIGFSVDVLINNAGVGSSTPFESISLIEWNTILQVNTTASFMLAQWAFQKLKSKPSGGLIIQISSMASVPAAEKFSGFTAYTASKYAVAGLIENIAVEGRPYGIHSICISPGAVDTKMLQQMAPHLQERLKPQEIAGFLVNLIKSFPKGMSGLNIPYHL